MKIEQIAFTGPDIERMKWNYSRLGAKEWVSDIVTAKGVVFGTATENIAELHFNYDLGFELELLQYIEGDNWLAHRPPPRSTTGIELSHKGLHVTKKEMDACKNTMLNCGVGIAQEVHTLNHTNPGVQGRKYHYVVFDSIWYFGFDLKLIERIMPTSLCEEKQCHRKFDISDQECKDCMQEARNG